MSTALFVQPSSPGWFGEISSLLEHRQHLPSTQLDLVAVRDRGVRDVLIRWNEIDWTDAALVQLVANGSEGAIQFVG